MKILKKQKTRSELHEVQSGSTDCVRAVPHVRDPLAYAAVLKALG